VSSVVNSGSPLSVGSSDGVSVPVGVGVPLPDGAALSSHDANKTMTSIIASISASAERKNLFFCKVYHFLSNMHY
jgi:hypothetical protein